LIKESEKLQVELSSEISEKVRRWESCLRMTTLSRWRYKWWVFKSTIWNSFSP